MQNRFRLGSGVVVLFAGSSTHGQPTTTGSAADWRHAFDTFAWLTRAMPLSRKSRC